MSIALVISVRLLWHYNSEVYLALFVTNTQ